MSSRSPYASRRAASFAEKRATSAFVRPGPTQKWPPSSSGRKFDIRRSTTLRPWRERSRSRMTLGLRSDTV